MVLLKYPISYLPSSLPALKTILSPLISHLSPLTSHIKNVSTSEILHLVMKKM